MKTTQLQCKLYGNMNLFDLKKEVIIDIDGTVNENGVIQDDVQVVIVDKKTGLDFITIDSRDVVKHLLNYYNDDICQTTEFKDALEFLRSKEE